MTKQEHLQFINNNPFEFSVSESGFTQGELEILKRYGNWFHALINEGLEPFSDEQHQFITEMISREEPTMEYVKLWKKYLRLVIEKEDDRGVLTTTPRMEDDPFYSREDVPSLRGTMYGVMNQSHRK